MRPTGTGEKSTWPKRQVAQRINRRVSDSFLLRLVLRTSRRGAGRPSTPLIGRCGWLRARVSFAARIQSGQRENVLCACRVRLPGRVWPATDRRRGFKACASARCRMATEEPSAGYTCRHSRRVPGPGISFKKSEQNACRALLARRRPRKCGMGAAAWRDARLARSAEQRQKAARPSSSVWDGHPFVVASTFWPS